MSPAARGPYTPVAAVLTDAYRSADGLVQTLQAQDAECLSLIEHSIWRRPDIDRTIRRMRRASISSRAAVKLARGV